MSVYVSMCRSVSLTNALTQSLDGSAIRRMTQCESR